MEKIFQLSETIGYWKKEAGKRLKVRILPDSLADKLRPENSPFECNYRFFVERGDFTPWERVKPVPEPGGVFLHLQGVQDEHMIQVKIASPGETWQSPATPQFMSITLERNP